MLIMLFPLGYFCREETKQCGGPVNVGLVYRMVSGDNRSQKVVTVTGTKKAQVGLANMFFLSMQNFRESRMSVNGFFGCGQLLKNLMKAG